MIEVAMFGAGRIGKIHGANLAAQPGVPPSKRNWELSASRTHGPPRVTREALRRP